MLLRAARPPARSHRLYCRRTFTPASAKSVRGGRQQRQQGGAEVRSDGSVASPRGSHSMSRFRLFFTPILRSTRVRERSDFQRLVHRRNTVFPPYLRSPAPARRATTALAADPLPSALTASTGSSAATPRPLPVASRVARSGRRPTANVFYRRRELKATVRLEAASTIAPRWPRLRSLR
jgi:hypothetical protein